MASYAGIDAGGDAGVDASMRDAGMDAALPDASMPDVGTDEDLNPVRDLPRPIL